MRSVLRAFTLAELIVAVAAVALLTVGIGQVFSSVGKLVGTGAALAEADQFARAISRQLNDDFAALNRMRSEDTFLAIRCRRIGDVNRNGALETALGERAIYLTRDDREADQRDGINAYAAGSRALTVRADEVMFLGLTSGFTTSQVAHPQGLEPTPGSPVARIYYGHGLRPLPDPLFDPSNPPLDSNVPRRQWLPDGDFGQRPGETNRFDPASPVLVTGRNEFAGDWLMLRQSLVLFGGTAAGYRRVPRSPFDPGIFYVPYIREQEVIDRFSGSGILNLNQSSWLRLTNFADPRLLSRGRVDLCAQSEEDVKRWLEGADPVTTPQPRDSSPYSDGRFDNDPSLDALLWTRTNAGVPADIRNDNTLNLQKAIAGCFARMQADDQPPFIDRADSPVSNTATPVGFASRDPAWTALMDTHATIGSRCSSFEVAWSDGTTWNVDTPLDLDGDSRPEYRRGDLIWFDIDLARFRRSTDSETAPGSPANDTSLASINSRHYPNWVPTDRPRNPEFRRGSSANLLRANPRLYDEDITGGPIQPSGEYLAIWGFREPDEVGGYAGAWQKPRLIRIRVTLHDAQFRIPGGRSYEFVYSIGN